MDLILWRHAEAQEWTHGCDDMARRLTSRGEKQAKRMAGWLDRQLPENTRILVSPTVRTEQTANALGRKFKIRPELAPDSTVAQLLELVQWSQGKGTVLVIGHQPTLGQTIAELIGLQASEFPVKKGAVWWLHKRQQETLVLTVQSPDLL
ncbi:MAG: phosphohistidine phosphatase SixA [Burkholderiales bacterium RIFOXYC12_FULL_60_6]|nr:MAG: phosphohistidine phosphatase SixA [Burkholderiales bacterium RIFOXYD12_FULL_59_19]OGB78252.1 MAG: phosphohistidine phosphatase SixA [Burkholderiales bacterium RIFOXYC12_FULL_60_6]